MGVGRNALFAVLLIASVLELNVRCEEKSPLAATQHAFQKRPRGRRQSARRAGRPRALTSQLHCNPPNASGARGPWRRGRGERRRAEPRPDPPRRAGGCGAQARAPPPRAAARGRGGHGQVQGASAPPHGTRALRPLLWGKESLRAAAPACAGQGREACRAAEAAGSEAQRALSWPPRRPGSRC